jgi:hypothetical protein
MQVFKQSTRYLCRILIKFEVSRQIFREMNKILIFRKIHPVGAELFHANGQPDVTKLIIAFRKSCERAN